MVNQKIAQLMLAKLGHEVDTVGNGREAVEAAHRVRYDVVLMSVALPELDGLGAMARMRAELPPGSQPRIFAVSSGVNAEDRSAFVSAGIDDFISTPFRLQELGALLSRGVPAPAPRADTRVEGIRERLENLTGPDSDEDRILFSQLLRSLASRAPEGLDDIEDAARRHDSAALTEHAHGLKGSVANLGGSELAGLLEDIEQRSRLGQPTDVAGLERVRRELTLFCGSLLVVADQLDRHTVAVGPVG